MSKSEYLVIAILALTASVAAASAIKPQTFVMDRVVVQISNPEKDWQARIPEKHRTLFSVHCELGGHAFSIDYSSRLGE